MDTPQSSFVLLEAWDCLAENRPADAVQMAEAWLTHHPQNTEAKLILSQGLLRMGKLERLYQLLRDVDHEIEQLSLTYLHLGELCRQSGLHAESERFCKKYDSIKKALSFADVLSEGEIITHKITPQEKDAEEGAIETIYPEFHTITLADLYMAQGHFERAKAVLADILSRDPENEEAVKKLAEANKALSDKAPGLFAVPKKNALDSRPIIAKLEGWLSRISYRQSFDL